MHAIGICKYTYSVPCYVVYLEFRQNIIYAKTREGMRMISLFAV